MVKKDKSLKNLYIENYSNTEFIYEDEIYCYLKKISNLIKNIKDDDMLKSNNAEDILYWVEYWKNYTLDLIYEIYNSFIIGNFISASAMTRTLIETYAYLRIVKENNDIDLAKNWVMCSFIRITQKYIKDKNLEIIKEYCIVLNLDYEEIILKFSKGNENKWLVDLLGKKRVTFEDICIYLGEEDIYKDFQMMSSFVHGQDITSKIPLFTFYSNIFHNFYIMMKYIFLTLNFYLVSEDLKSQLEELRLELQIIAVNHI